MRGKYQNNVHIVAHIALHITVRGHIYKILLPSISITHSNLHTLLNALLSSLLPLHPDTLRPHTLLFPQPLKNNGMRLRRRLNLKQLIHTLQRHALGFRNEEVNERDRQDHERGEEEIDAVAHLEKHLRGEARDDEVPEPVVCGGGGLAQGARVLGEHFRVDDPGGAVPGWLSESVSKCEDM